MMASSTWWKSYFHVIEMRSSAWWISYRVCEIFYGKTFSKWFRLNIFTRIKIASLMASSPWWKSYFHVIEMRSSTWRISYLLCEIFYENDIFEVIEMQSLIDLKLHIWWLLLLDENSNFRVIEMESSTE